MEFKHISVLLDETIEELHIKPDGIYVDGTLGGGGHAYHVCQKLSEKGRYIGILLPDNIHQLMIHIRYDRFHDHGRNVLQNHLL